jgi:amino-acid N-acetyltransferase
MVVSILPARPSDFDEMAALLSSCGLPIDGLEEHLDKALVAFQDGQLAGCVALELFGSAALLRSLAVAPARRGERLGLRLTQAALDLARGAGSREVFLLTETAAGFFPRLGFAPIGREQVPAAVRRSVEFGSACPASAAVMRLGLV